MGLKGNPVEWVMRSGKEGMPIEGKGVGRVPPVNVKGNPECRYLTIEEKNHLNSNHSTDLLKK